MEKERGDNINSNYDAISIFTLSFCWSQQTFLAICMNHTDSFIYSVLFYTYYWEQATITMADNNETTEQEISDMTPLFSKEGDEDGELFRDKVRCVFEKFDQDKDGYLNFEELAALQKKTAGTELTKELFVMACKALTCEPQTGIHLEALKLTYAAEGSDIGRFHHHCRDWTIFLLRPRLTFRVLLRFLALLVVVSDKDYYKVFPERKPKKKKAKEGEDEVFEIGVDGSVDISSW